MSHPSTSVATQDTPHGAGESELFMLAGLGAIIRWLEELASLLSGPVLTLGLGIALIDLLTDGRLLASVPALLFAWAASQAVGLDAQLVGSSAKLAAALRRRRWLAALGFTLLVVALGAVAYQASAVFAIQQADGISTQTALTRLGMDTATWLLERSALAVFLVVLSGLLRYVAPAKMTVTLEDERAKLERELTLEPLRQRLRATQVGGWRSVAEQALHGQTPTPVPTPEAVTTPPSETPPELPPDGPQDGGRHDPDDESLTHYWPALTPWEPSSLPGGKSNGRQSGRSGGNGYHPVARSAERAAGGKKRGKMTTKRSRTMLANATRRHQRVEQVRGWLADGEAVSKRRIRAAYGVDNDAATGILAEARRAALHAV